MAIDKIDKSLTGMELYEKINETIDNISSKVDKVSGKQLSTEDYTTAEKNKLAGIQAGAEVNVQSDWNETNPNSDAYIKNKPTNLATDEELSSAITSHNTSGSSHADLRQSISSKVSIDSIVDNLVTNASNVPLSANQGKILKDYIGTISDLTTVSKANLVASINELVTKVAQNTLDIEDLYDDSKVIDGGTFS